MLHQPASKVESTDATGADDAFHVDYIYELVSKIALKKRLVFGAAVDALKCRWFGTRSEFPL